MPERERVPGMEAAVLELVDRAQMQARQADELAHTRFVEELIPDDRASTCHRRRPSTTPEVHAGARAAAAVTFFLRPTIRAMTVISASIATARWIDRCSVKTTAQATEHARKRPRRTRRRPTTCAAHARRRRCPAGAP